MKRLFILMLLWWPLAALSQEQAEEDKGYLTQLLQDNLSGDDRIVTISGFAGALSSQATITQLTVADSEGVWLSLEDITLDWNRTALLRGRVEVDELTAAKISIIRPPLPANDLPNAEAQPFALPELPVGISIGNLAAGRIELGEAFLGEPVAVTLQGNVSLAGGEGTGVVTANRLDGKAGQFVIDGSYSNATSVLDLNLLLDEASDGIVARLLNLPGRPSVTLEIAGTGPVSTYAATLSLATDGTPRIAGSFNLDQTSGLSQVAVDVGGDLSPLVAPAYRDFFGVDSQLVATGAQTAQGGFDLSALDLTTKSLRLTGQARIGAQGWPERLSLSGAVTAPDGARVILPVAGGQTTVDRIDLAIGYDAARSDDWTAEFNILGLARPGMSIADISLDGGGVIRPGTGPAPGTFTADLRYGATGVALDDAGSAQAFGDSATGEFTLDYAEGGPTRITRFSLSGPGVAVTADATIKGPQDGFQTQSNILFDVAALERFSTLAGRALSGAANLSVVSTITPLDGLFDVIVAGETADLAVDIAQLDPLLRGAGRMSFIAERDTEGTRVRALSLMTDAATVTADASLTSGASAANVDIRVIDAGLVLEGQSGPAALTGQLIRDEARRSSFIIAGTAPGLRLDVDGTADPAEGGQTVNAKLRATIDELRDYAALAGQDLSGGLTLEADAVLLSDGMRFDADITARTSDLQTGITRIDPLLLGAGRISASLARTGQDRYALRDLDLTTPQMTLRGMAQGSLAGTGNVDLALTIADMAVVAPGLNGPLAVSADGERRDDGAANLQLRAAGPGTDVTIDATVANTAAGSEITGTLDAALDDLTPYQALIGRPVSGGIDVILRGTALPDGSRFDATVDGTLRSLQTGIAQLDPLLAGQGRITGRAARTGPDAYVVEGLNLTTPQMQLMADFSGGLSTAAEGRARLEMTDVSAVAPGLTGPLMADLTANRPAGADAAVVLNATAPGAVVAIDASVGLASSGYPVTGTLTADIADLRPYRTLIGQPVSGGLQARASGTLLPDLSRFDLQADVATRAIGIGNTTVDLLLAGSGTLRAAVARTDVGLRVRDFALQTANLSATGRLDGIAGNGSGAFSARLRDIGLFTDALSGPVTAEGTANRTNGSWGVDVDAAGPGGITARVDGQIAAAGRLDLAVQGRAPLGLANGAIEPRRLDGFADIDLAVNGPAALSSLSGRISTTDGRLAAPTIGQALSNISGAVTLGGGRASIDLIGTVASGGTVAVTGPVALAAPFNGDIAADLRGVVLRDPNLYETVIDGRIGLAGPLANGARISGALNLGVTEVRVPSSGIGALGDLPLVSHVGAPADVRQTLTRAGAVLDSRAREDRRGVGPSFPLDITIAAPSRIFIRGRGLDAELGGNLRIGGTSAAIVPSGEFNLLRGRLDILQQRFDLTEGTATLQGDFAPYLRLVAATETASGTIVRIIVEGTADAPEVTFSATPDLPQDEVLSQLIFGRNLSEISPLQAVQLAAAVGTLAGRGGGGLIDNFRQGIGLDDFDVVTDGDGNAAVRAGKYLSENVYTDVTVSSDGSTDININLDVTDTVTAKGTVNADGETSLGIFYERDY